MSYPFDTMETFLFLLRFLLGSTLIFGLVWAVEKAGLLRNRDMADITWKMAIVASFFLLIPISADYAGEVDLTTSASSEIGKWILPDEDLSKTKIKIPETYNLTSGPDLTKIIKAKIESDSTKKLPAQKDTKKPTLQNDTAQKATDIQVWKFPRFMIIPSILAILALISLVITYAAAIKSLGKRERVRPNHPAFTILFDICEEANIKGTPYLTWTEAIDSPLCLPTGEIVLPKWAMSGISTHELKGLIGHELAHLKRHDPIILLILHALSRLFFLQPLFTLAQKRLADLAELAADEWASSHSDNPKSVAEALFTCAKKITNKRQPQWGLAMAKDKSKLKARVERLLAANDSEFTKTPTWIKGTVAAALMATALSVPTIGLTTLVTTDNPIAPRADKRPVKAARAPRAKLASVPSIASVPAVPAIVDLRDNGNISMSQNSKGKRPRGNFTWNNDDYELKIKWNGAYSIASDDSTIISVDGDGYFKVYEEKDGIERSVKFTMPKGKIITDFRYDGDKRPMTAKDKEWLKTTLVNYMRKSGANADQRVKYMLKSGGAKAVFTEMSYVSDYALKHYLKALMEAKKLKTSEVNSLIKILARIKSDYSMRQTFGLLLNNYDLPKGALPAVLKAAKNIQSDYEMRQLLTPLVGKQKMSGQDFTILIDLLETVESDYELRQLFMVTLKQKNISNKNLTRMLKIMKDSIESDYEMRQIIVAIASKLTGSADATKLAIDTMNTIESDYEKRQAVIAVIKKGKMTDANWKAIIKSSEDINSDYELSQVIIFMTANAPKDKAITKALIALSENISSKYERKKVSAVLDI